MAPPTPESQPPDSKPSRPTTGIEEERLCEELLILAAKAGDAGAFERLVKSWHERLWRHAFRLTQREDSAWDVMQETWLGVSRGIARLEDPAAFRRWAYTIVTRAAAGHLRRTSREIAQSTEVIDQNPAPDSGESDLDDAVRGLRVALGRLDPVERALVSMRYLEGFELWELALILDIPEGTVKSRLHRARTRLREILERLQR